MSRKHRKKRHGHWCWCCDRVLPNERFSGGGHARHLCKPCAGLPSQERDYRQVLRDIERIQFRPGKFKGRRAALEAWLKHEDPRGVAHVQEMLRWEEWRETQPVEESIERDMSGIDEDIPF